MKFTLFNSNASTEEERSISTWKEGGKGGRTWKRERERRKYFISESFLG